MKAGSKIKLTLYLVALFLAGVVTGGIVTVQVVRHMMPNQERIAQRWSAELRSKLDLSSEQSQAIDPIIRDTLTAFRTSFAERAMSALTNGNAQIALKLSDKQKKRFASIARGQENFITKVIGGNPSTTNR